LPPGKKRTALEARALRVLANVRIEVVTEPVAEMYGRIKASLESQGLILEDNDLWIAATALALGSTVVTRDGIFARVGGLHVEDWSV
jgi:tRNA(fMet)-specific endonuclease VapC